MAIREKDDRPPGVLSGFFDRPVFVEEIACYPPGRDAPYPGKFYSTGFGMSVGLYPEPAVIFGGNAEYRIRYSVRDRKGRRTNGEAGRIPRLVTHHG
jgi:hypothetical protein